MNFKNVEEVVKWLHKHRTTISVGDRFVLDGVTHEVSAIKGITFEFVQVQ